MDVEQVNSGQERDPAKRDLDYFEHDSKRNETDIKRIVCKIEYVGIQDRMKSVRKRYSALYTYYVN